MSYKLRIEQDTDPENPRTAWNQMGTMICWHRLYQLGDKHDYSVEAFELPEGAVYLPLYLYDHGGLVMSTESFHGRAAHGAWDSMQVGWIYATPQQIRVYFGVKYITAKVRAKAEELLAAEVETYSQYLQGDVWGYVIEDEDGNHVDSCWGMFGRKYAEEEGQKALDYAIRREEKVAAEIANIMAL